MYFSNDFKQHKQQIDAVRIFAQELGRLPGGKQQGVGIPSFSVATRGQINLKELGDRPLGKKIERPVQKAEERIEAFGLHEDINHRKIKEMSQRFMLGLMSHDDFALYLDRIITLIDKEIIRYEKRSVGGSMSDWQEEFSNKTLFDKIVQNLKFAITEFRLYLQDSREKHITTALGQLSSASKTIQDIEERKASLEEIGEGDLTPHITKKPSDMSGLNSVYNTNKLNLQTNDLASGFTTKKLSIQETEDCEKKSPNPGISPLQPLSSLTQKQPYMVSAAPSWHSHYKGEKSGIKGYDLAYVSHIFKHLTFKQLDDIADKISIEKYDRGVIIFREREEGDKIYIIKSGKVMIYKRTLTGRETEIMTLSPGDILGEVSCIDGGAYEFNAKIHSEGTTLLAIGKNNFRELLKKYPSLSQNLNSLSSLRLRDLYNKLTA
ncbi:MAG: cyclic nucleotide-binding domain-containing protein [Candidatus Eremiobacterota bacterium]